MYLYLVVHVGDKPAASDRSRGRRSGRASALSAGSALLTAALPDLRGGKDDWHLMRMQDTVPQLNCKDRVSIRRRRCAAPSKPSPEGEREADGLRVSCCASVSDAHFKPARSQTQTLARSGGGAPTCRRWRVRSVGVRRPAGSAQC